MLRRSTRLSKLKCNKSHNGEGAKSKFNKSVSKTVTIGPKRKHDTCLKEIVGHSKRQKISSELPSIAVFENMTLALTKRDLLKVEILFNNYIGQPPLWREEKLCYFVTYLINSNNLFAIQVLVSQASLFKGDDVKLKGIIALSLFQSSKQGKMDITRYFARQIVFKHGTSGLNIQDEQGNTALHLCQISCAAAQITEFLLRYNVKCNILNKKGQTALMKALENKNIESIILLFNREDGRGGLDNTIKVAEKYGLDKFVTFLSVNANFDDPLIIRAALKCNIEVLDILLTSGCFDVNAKNPDGDNALTALFNSKLLERNAPSTRQSQSTECLELMQNSFEDVIIDYSRYSLSQFSKEEIQVIKHLLLNGANVHIGGHYGIFNSPFHMCCEFKNISLLKMFLCNNYKIDTSDTYVTALEIAIVKGRHDFIDVIAPLVTQLKSAGTYEAEVFCDVIYTALQKGTKEMLVKVLTFIDLVDFPVAMEYACCNSFDIYILLKEMFSKEFNDHVQKEAGNMWLSYAVEYDLFHIVKDLLECKAPINGYGDNSSHPLIYVRSKRVVDALFTYGCDINDPSKNFDIGIAALRKNIIVGKGCNEDDNKDILKSLFDNGLKMTFNVFACLIDEIFPCYKKISKLICFQVHKYDWDLDTIIPNCRLNFCPTLLGKAVKLNYCDWAEALLKKGASQELTTLLTYCIKRRRVPMVKCLLSNGADPNKKNSKAQSPIELAAEDLSIEDDDLLYSDFLQNENDDLFVISMLESNGCFLDGESGHRALINAAKRNSLKIFKKLHGKGAEINRLEFSGNSILDNLLVNYERINSRVLDYEDIIIYILRHGGKIYNTFSLYPFFISDRFSEKYSQFNMELIHSGTFRPLVLSEVDKFYSGSIDYTPFLQALKRNDYNLACHMQECFFMTRSDLFGPNQRLIKYIRGKKYMMESSKTVKKNQIKSWKVLNKFWQSPPSLLQICMAHVSDSLKEDEKLSRQDKVASLGLPYPLGDSLIFRSPNQLRLKKVYLENLDNQRSSNGESDSEDDVNVGDIE